MSYNTIVILCKTLSDAKTAAQYIPRTNNINRFFIFTNEIVMNIKNKCKECFFEKLRMNLNYSLKHSVHKNLNFLCFRVRELGTSNNI